MKKITFLPGFEFAFALSIMLIMALPHMVTAQDHKEFKVDINNGDTTVNGKSIKSLSAAERTDALKNLRELSRDVVGDNYGKRIMMTQRRMIGDSSTMRRGEMWRPMARVDFKRRDSTGRGPEMMHNRMMMHNEGNREQGSGQRSFKRDNNFADGRRADRGERMGMHGDDGGFDHRRNTEKFSFSNVDRDGISTHITYRVSDAEPRNSKRISGTEKPDLSIQDMTLTPMFSTGKTALSLSLAAKTAADVEFKDTEGTVLWTGKTSNGDFSKIFELPKNGVYYLQIKQGGKTALRKIVKEE